MKKQQSQNTEESKLNDMLGDLTKKYGEGTFLTQDYTVNVEAIPTGCYSLDELFGCGGIPRGRIIEIYGSPSSGKTTMALFIAGQIQQQGKKILFIDAEQAYDKVWSAKLGVNTSELIVAQESCLETAMDILINIVKTNTIDMIIVDSVDALIPRQELEVENLEKDTIGLKARKFTPYLRLLNAEAAKSKTVVIFINQTRANIGVMYGPKETTPGGKALGFYASVRLHVGKGEVIKDGSAQIGNRVKIDARKNKVGFPFKQIELDLYYASGIDLYGDVLDKALERGIITKAGNTHTYEDKKIGVGKEQAKHFLRENQESYDAIRHRLVNDTDSTPVG